MARHARRLQQASSADISQPLGPNLLIGKVFTADVADSTTETGHPIAHATDQNGGTRWISQPTSPMNMTANLGGVYDLTRLVIVFAADTIHNYTVSVSTNGSSYTQIASGVTNNTTQQTVTITSFSGTPKGRYLRITGTDRWNVNFGNSIWEVEAYGTLDSAFPSGSIASFNGTVISNTQINLSWSYSGSPLTNYTLTRNGLTIANPAAGATTFNNTGLTAGTNYTYTLTGNFTVGGTTNTVNLSRTTTGGSIKKVMPLGDSITDGYNIPGGYRKRLWQRLVTDEGYNFDFVGSLSNGPAELGDKNHEGHSGWKIRDVRANLDSYINNGQPDIVLVMLGSNDTYANDDLPNAPERLQELIERMHVLRPGLVTIVSTATNRADQQEDIPVFNAELPTVVTALNNMGYDVHLVDAYSALTLSDLADSVHPNAAGYDKLADVWYPKLKAYLDGNL